MKTTSKTKSRVGFTLTELMIVLATVSMLATLAIPNMVRARDAARLTSIYSNLRQLDQAKSEWAVDQKQPTGAPVDNLAALGSYFRNGGLQDVMRETYIPNPVGSPPQAELPTDSGLGPYDAGATIPAP